MTNNKELLKTLTRTDRQGFPLNHFTNWTQFRKCNAYTSDLQQQVINDKKYSYKLVKSYNTIVGLADLDNWVFYELGKWSRTTSKQVTQIYNSIFSSMERKYIDLYN